MNLQETCEIMDIIDIAYPGFYKGIDDERSKKTAALWCSMFRDDPVQIVATAVKAFIVSSNTGYAPRIGQIKEKIRFLTTPDELSEGEAWSLVANALRNGIYSSKEEFEKLPPDIQRIVGSPNMLREWAMMDVEAVQSVVASNFQRAYRKRVAKKAEFEKLPSNIKAVVGPLANKFAFEKGAGELPAIESVGEA